MSGQAYMLPSVLFVWYFYRFEKIINVKAISKLEGQMEGKEEFLYEFLSHLGVTVGYLLLVSFFLLGFSFSFCIGGLLGMNILDLDHLLYVFTHLKEESCQKFVRRWHEKKYKEAIFHIVGSHKKYNRKLLHNAIFATALAVFAVFSVLISHDSLFQVGLVLSVFLHLLKDIIGDLKNMAHLKEWLFWFSKKPVKDGVLIIYISLLALIFLFSTFMVGQLSV